jgi:hypothetical protein
MQESLLLRRVIGDGAAPGSPTRLDATRRVSNQEKAFMPCTCLGLL